MSEREFTPGGSAPGTYTTGWTAPDTQPAPASGEGEALREALYRAGATRGMTYGYDDVDGHIDRLVAAVLPFITAAHRERDEAREKVLLGFTEWVATNRAYNGSNHAHGQSLYNECLNGVLREWALDYAAALGGEQAGDGGREGK